MILLGHKSTKYIFTYVQLAHIYFGGVKKYVTILIIQLLMTIWFLVQAKKATNMLEPTPKTEQASIEKSILQPQN
jgi:hypothetical protein